MGGQSKIKLSLSAAEAQCDQATADVARILKLQQQLLIDYGTALYAAFQVELKITEIKNESEKDDYKIIKPLMIKKILLRRQFQRAAKLWSLMMGKWMLKKKPPLRGAV